MELKLVRRLVVRRLALAAVVLMTGGGALFAPATARPAPSGQCIFKGPTASGTATTLIPVNTNGVSCAFAVEWAKKFVARTSQKYYVHMEGGPPGYTCIDLTPKGDRIVNGLCSSGGGHGFGWN